MSNTIPVIYIGPKDKKRDTITGSRLVFPRLEPVDVETAIAHRLLEFPTVFIKAGQLESVLEQKGNETALREEAEQLAQLRLATEAAANSFVVRIGNDEIDLAKMTAVQLATLVEAEELPDLVKGAQEKVEAFRTRVRDAMNAKHPTNQEGGAA
ncbi:Uncharacterised protein [Serratia fonticola]|uniref:hypothetical protein n=1 Tax=Serratia fonticola TaxID=47917 RepID=UPI002179535C|nr:hypothetical protein [Serratia fonticola]CAI0694830.1 Uncharacterised protein [Serratia fonticola]